MTDFGMTIEEGGVDSGGYIARLLELLGDRDPLETMAELVPSLRGDVAGLPQSVLTEPETEGKWSIVDVVQHLLDSEMVYLYRMRLIVAQPGAQLPAYDQDAWAERLRYRDTDLEAALGRLGSLREGTLSWLGTLSAAELALTGIHEERGQESVGHIVRLLAAHDLNHRSQIERIKWAVLAAVS